MYHSMNLSLYIGTHGVKFLALVSTSLFFRFFAKSTRVVHGPNRGLKEEQSMQGSHKGLGSNRVIEFGSKWWRDLKRL